MDIGARELQRVREENELLHTVIAAHARALAPPRARADAAELGRPLRRQLIEPFTLERFYENRLVSDLAAAVSHWSEDKRGRRP
jgi:hypothetical protein